VADELLTAQEAADVLKLKKSTVNEMIKRMPHCFGIGQAAGTAAAMAVRKNIEVRDVNYAELRNELRAQDIYLPKNSSEKAPAKAETEKQIS